MKRVRECVYVVEPDLQTLIWTRGWDFPLTMFENRLKRSRCGSRRVRVAFGPPGSVRDVHRSGRDRARQSHPKSECHPHREPNTIAKFNAMIAVYGLPRCRTSARIWPAALPHSQSSVSRTQRQRARGDAVLRRGSKTEAMSRLPRVLPTVCYGLRSPERLGKRPRRFLSSSVTKDGCGLRLRSGSAILSARAAAGSGRMRA